MSNGFTYLQDAVQNISDGLRIVRKLDLDIFHNICNCIAFVHIFHVFL